MTDFRGMTINERLSEAGLFAKWDRAIQKKDRPAMISMLVSVDLTPHEAEWTANEVLWGRFLDAQRRLLDSMSLSDLGQVYSAMFGRPADLSIGTANVKALILTEIRLNRPTAST